MNEEITVENGGTVLRGVAVPFGVEEVVATPGPGKRIAHREVFDAVSVADVGSLYGNRC